MSRKQKSHLNSLPSQPLPLADLDAESADGVEWEAAVAASDALDCIPDLHASVSRVRARLRQQIRSDPTS